MMEDGLIYISDSNNKQDIFKYDNISIIINYCGENSFNDLFVKSILTYDM